MSEIQKKRKKEDFKDFDDIEELDEAAIPPKLHIKEKKDTRKLDAAAVQKKLNAKKKKHTGNIGKLDSAAVQKKLNARKKRDEFKDVDDIEELDATAARTKLHVKKITKKKEVFRERVIRKTRAEILNNQEEGNLSTGGNLPTYLIRQQDIVENVDIASATKHFNLDLDHGPYKADYTLNGRHLLLGGKDGHVAAFDWMTKRLHTEIQISERVKAVRWLHNENMLAVAQKRYTHIYDRNGTELHCVKGLHDIHSLEFLPRHFLLAGLSSTNFLSYLDVSTGQLVSACRIKQAEPTCMTQNRSNAVIVSGNCKGVVCMWTPNQKEAVVEILANRAPLSGISIHKEGVYMATIGLDSCMKLWDLRTYKELGSYRLPFPPTQIDFSDKQKLAVAFGSNIHIYSNIINESPTHPYMQYTAASPVSSLSFCPYEDVLGVGHNRGFCSLLIPGSGDPNFDALHANPFESKGQRQEREVRQLLEKIQPNMITLNPRDINRVNQTELQKNMEYRDKEMHWKNTELNINPSRFHNRKKTLK